MGNIDEEELDLVTRLSQIGVSLSVEKNLDTLLELIVEEVSGFLNADGCTLYMVEEGRLQFTISRNISLGLRMGGKHGQPIHIPPLPLDESFVSAYAVLNRKTVNIPDVYTSDLFDFTGPKKFDEERRYRTVSMLVVPMTDHDGEVIGALQLVNAADPVTGDIGPFQARHVILAESLASQAAVAISNSRLLHETERLFEAFLQVMATGLDARSKYTHGHVRRVAGLTMELAAVIGEETVGPYADVTFSENDLRELWIAGWMHDIGKIVSPPHIMDKSTKLEGIHDRVELVTEKFRRYRETVKNRYLSAQIALLKEGATDKAARLEEEMERETARADEDATFVAGCNEPGEFMTDERIERLKEIAARYLLPEDGTHSLLTEEEIYNLSIRKGSLNAEERKIMEDHIVVTIRMLEKIPFPRKLKNAPFYAGAHHERLDGKGYPQGLTATQMPLQARMLAITDFLEALTASDRPYKKPMPIERAISILRDEAKRGALDADLIELIERRHVFERFQANDANGAYVVSGDTPAP
jgi:HD-GYP domain-containing protein (c-di-GMP phosphodiesterase class II)